jgi:hypothetical protein
VPWRPALPRGRSKALTVALAALAAALAADACAQTFAPNPFEPSLIDPNRAQRFGKPPDGTTRASQPAATQPAGTGAGDTGFDSTGSIAKKRKAKRKPGSTFPIPRATTSTPYGAPQQSTGQTAAPQIAARAAYANVYKPPDAPVRRPLPPNTDPYEPVGVRVGGFLLRPSIEVGYGVDSNPNRTPGGPRSNFTQVLPELQVKSQWARHELGATLRGSYYAYDTLSSANRPSADAKLFGRYDVTRDLRIEGEGRFLLGTDNPGSPNLQAGLARLPIYTTWGATAGVAQRFNRLDLSVKGSFDRTTYQDSELEDGTRVSNQERNYNQHRVQGRASYEFGPGLKPFVEIDADKRVHDSDASGRDSQGLTPKAGVTFELLRYLTGEVSAGYTMRDYVSPALEPLQGFVVDASLVWVATGLTTMTFTANSRADESVLLGVSGALRREVGLQVDHAFRRWLIGTVKVGYGQDDYVGLDRLDQRTSLGAMITYKFSRELWLKGEYRHEWLRSNVTGVDYDASIFLIGLKLQR